MIKIYDSSELTTEFLEIIQNERFWSYPPAEIDYLLETRPNENFVYLNKRLKETNNLEIEKYIKK